MILTLYHGSNFKINNFSPKFFNTGTNRQQLGVGFYFSDDMDVASMYGKYIHECSVRIGNKLNLRKTGKLKTDTISWLIKNAPNYKEKLSNFGDLDVEGYYTVLNKAVFIYNYETVISKKLFNLENDFFDGDEYLFNQLLYKSSLKLNCIYDKIDETNNLFFKNGSTIYNIFLPEQIKIIKIFEN